MSMAASLVDLMNDWIESASDVESRLRLLQHQQRRIALGNHCGIFFLSPA
jgi:hypothetical protein